MSGPYDYSLLQDNNVAETARTAAFDIRNSFNHDIRKIGKLLCSVKEAMKHGHFGRWAIAELQITSRTAQRYMQAANFLEGKSDTVSHLPSAVIYALASAQTSADLIERIVEADARRRPMSVKEIRKALASERREQEAERLRQWKEGLDASQKAIRLGRARTRQPGRAARQVTG